MKKQNGKSNIDILKDYVAGVRPFIQTGYVGNASKRKSEGEVWKDTKGITWEQKKGYKVRVNKQADIIRAASKETCKSCGKDLKWGAKVDRTFFNKTKMCLDCVINYETKLRILGIYECYENYKLASNYIGHLTEVKEQLKDSISLFSNGGGDMEMICNSEGFIERWKTNDKELIIKDIKKDLKTITALVTKATKARNIAKKEYIKNASKYKLEVYV